MIEVPPNASKLKICDASKELRKLRRVQGFRCGLAGFGLCFTCPVNAFSSNLGVQGVTNPSDVRL